MSKYRVQCKADGCGFVFNCVTRQDALWVIREHEKLTGHYRKVNYIEQ